MLPARTLRVLYLARAPFVSGAERALLSMLRHLDSRRVQAGAVLGTHTRLVDTLGQWNTPAWQVALPRRTLAGTLAWWRSLRRLERVIEAFMPDVLHANDVPSCQAASVLGTRRGLPVVIHVRWGITAGDIAWWARGGAASVLCISQWVREQLGDTAGTALAGAPIEVLPDAVDWPASAAADLDPNAPAAAERPAVPVIAFAGQLIPDKGLELLIEALARLPADRRPQLEVAGRDTQRGGTYLRHLQQLAARLGVTDRIAWRGFVEDMAGFYRRADAVVCPSRLEPLGLVPLEAAQWSLPAIANRVGGLAETILDGQTGWLLEPTVDAWARALGRLEDRAALARMGRAARQRTIELYSPAVYQRRLMAVYEGLGGAWSKG